MIVDYVKWFCEFMNVPYETNELLEVWAISKKQNKEFEINYVCIAENNTKQLSLFDFDVAI